MASVVVGVIGVLTEEPHLPFIRGQPQGRWLRRKSAGQRGLAGAGQADHQVQSCHDRRSLPAFQRAGNLLYAPSEGVLGRKHARAGSAPAQCRRRSIWWKARRAWNSQ